MKKFLLILSIMSTGALFSAAGNPKPTYTDKELAHAVQNLELRNVGYPELQPLNNKGIPSWALDPSAETPSEGALRLQGEELKNRPAAFLKK